MPVTSGNTFCLSSSLLKVDEEAIVTRNKGIVSILGSDSTQTKAGSTTSSLRRTLSADMSPSKLLSQNCFSFGLPSSFVFMKNAIAVTDEVENEDQERPGQDDVWRLIQSQKKKVDEKPEGGQVDVWGSILAQKDKEDGSKSSSSSEAYVPSVMKRSTSCPLNEKSLEICTESLGSETGCDVFSSGSPSESEGAEEENDAQEAQTETHGNDLKELVHQVVPKCNFSINKKPSSRSFPPPLPSLPRPDAPCLLMKPHRKNGRLVLQAVPIPSQNCFHAARQDGRLLLTFANDSDPKDVDDDKEEQLFENFELGEDHQVLGDEKEKEEEDDGDEDADDEEDMEKETVILIEQVPEKYTTDVTNVPKSVIVMKKLMRIDNSKAKWNTTQNFNISVNSKGMKPAEEEGIHHLTPQSFPRPPLVGRLIPSPLPTAATSFNAYDYFWRAKSTPAATVANSTNIKDYPVFKKNNKVQLSQNLRENRADYLLPLFKGCKEEPRRPHLAREPHCIATS